jgi:hypothetical protein
VVLALGTFEGLERRWRTRSLGRDNVVPMLQDSQRRGRRNKED